MHYMPGYKIYLNWTRDLKKQNTYLWKKITLQIFATTVTNYRKLCD